MSEAELAQAHEWLAAQAWPLSALRGEQRRLWSRAIVVDELGCGWDHGRLLIPLSGRSGGLRGMLRYAPRHDRAPKMLAAIGTRLGLVPHPAAEPSEWIVLVEGPPDMISARPVATDTYCLAKPADTLAGVTRIGPRSWWVVNLFTRLAPRSVRF